MESICFNAFCSSGFMFAKHVDFIIFRLCDTILIFRVTLQAKKLFSFTHNQLSMLNSFNANQLIRNFG